VDAAVKKKWGMKLALGEFDYVPGWRLRTTDGSRGDVRAKGEFVEDESVKGYPVWSLEIMRKLDTGHPDEDVIFSDLDRAYPFALAVMDDSGIVHSGSSPQRLVFEPRSP
jgi:hypothetical protein